MGIEVVLGWLIDNRETNWLKELTDAKNFID
jgi:hypothetical protein